MKISKIVRMSIIIFVVLSLVMYSLLFLLFSAMNKSEIAESNAEQYIEQGNNISKASDYLTACARDYVVTKDRTYYDAYWDEVNNKKSRENAVNKIKELGALESELEVAEEVVQKSNNLAIVEERAFNAVEKGELEEARELVFGKEYRVLKNEIVSDIEKFKSMVNERAINISDDAKKNTEKFLSIVISSVNIIIVLGLGGYFIILRKIKPINSLVEISEQIVEGNLTVNFDINSKDEIGMMSEAFQRLADTISNIVEDINYMADMHTEGDYEYFIDEDKYSGSYQELIKKVNSMLAGNTENFLSVMNLLQSFGEGNFDAPVKKYPGKQAIGNEIIEGFREKLKSVYVEIYNLELASLNGDLSARVDVGKFKGDWAKICVGLNELVEAIVIPIEEAAKVLELISQGNLCTKVTGDYKGDFGLIKNSLNNTVDTLSDIINDITATLTAISKSDIRGRITMEYRGEFSAIKESINLIIDNLNRVIGEIHSASEQVNLGARHMSESSMNLANGASEQASTVEELNLTITNINEMTQNNAKFAKEAELLSKESMENAAAGNKEMALMLESMNGIKDASDDIAKIINVIDDISFQTNLLALNAAVEAARAGQQGKGFAVVAEEVRSLAGKSQEAAQNTQHLIDDTIRRITEGTKIANQTSNALSKIVDNIEEVSDIISNISSSSNKQAEAMEQMSSGVAQISDIIQHNSATSEEGAASSEELSSQAETLNNLISTFQRR